MINLYEKIKTIFKIKDHLLENVLFILGNINNNNNKSYSSLQLMIGQYV